VEALLRYAQEHYRDKSSGQFTLFDTVGYDSEHSLLLAQVNAWSQNEALLREFEAFGFYLSAHPVAAYEAQLKKLGVTQSVQIEALASNKSLKMNLAGVVVSRKVKSSKRGKYAFFQLSDPYGLAEVCVFNEPLLIKHNDLLQVGNLVYITADARKDESGLRVVVESVTSLADAIKNIILQIKIEVRENGVIPKLASLLRQKNTGNVKVVTLHMQLQCGSIVQFKSTKPFYIRVEDESIIRQMHGVVVRDA
jgi:DNA polymerase-3 subunit alpha